MEADDVRDLTLNDLLVKLDAFVERQHARTGAERLSEDGLDGLVVAKEALADIVAGRMWLR